MKYLITGNAGTGKSSVVEELKQRGFTAYNTDDLPEVTRFEYKATSQPAVRPEPPTDWSTYAWNWQEGGLRKLLESADTVFVAAIVSNQERFYSLFHNIFVLTADVETIRHRLQNRDTNDYGKNPEQLKEILEGHEEFQRNLLNVPTATEIDSRQPLKKVVDQIIALANEN
ncbi:AAA family ATPase [Candidatus Saccharibacteria bacterium]|nr:AAA family ATPase [Candidatus Saccharibacteria bacterium]